MASFTLGEILKATNGRLITTGRPGRVSSAFQKTINGISIDTRTIRSGELFIAIVGKRHDGHQFVAEALSKGACGAVVSQLGDLATDGHWFILVPDTKNALGDIAAFHRRRFHPLVIGITGSNGKSTTKEMLASILKQRYRVLKPAGSFNNDIGVPLTLLRLTARTEVAIVEMEMNLLGGTRRLCAIAQPQIGIVTNIADTHLEFMNDRYGVAAEKSELIEAVGMDGVAVLNRDDPLVMAIGRRYRTRETITFGFSPAADLFATQIRPVVPDIGYARRTQKKHRQLRIGSYFRLNGRFPVRLPVPGRHNIANALAALSAAGVAGIHLHEALAGLEDFSPLPLRLQVERWRNLTLLLDCYNANPQSMSAALEVLSCVGNKRKIAVLADMLELGSAAPQAHEALGEEVGKRATIVVTCGEFAPYVAMGARRAGMGEDRILEISRPEQLPPKLVDILRPGDTILFKGSRANSLEELVREFRKLYRK